MGLYNKSLIYSTLLLCLTISSVAVHSYNNIYINIIDKIIIFVIICYDLYLIYCKAYLKNTIKIIAIFFTLFFVLFMYIGGYFLKEFCFEPYEKNTEIYHILMHFIGSLGNHWILFL